MPSPPDQLQELKDQLLMASLPHIVFDGWSKGSLNAGSISIGKEIGYPYSLFSDPVKEMVAHFSNWADREMLKKLDAVDLQSLKIRQRITTSVRYRLESLADHEEAVSRLHRVGAHIVVMPEIVGGKQLANAILEMDKSEELSSISAKPIRKG